VSPVLPGVFASQTAIGPPARAQHSIDFRLLTAAGYRGFADHAVQDAEVNSSVARESPAPRDWLSLFHPKAYSAVVFLKKVRRTNASRT